MKDTHKFLIFSCFVLISALIYQEFQFQNFSKLLNKIQIFSDNIQKSSKAPEKSDREFLKELKGKIDIEFNYPIALSGKTKKEIYDIRKEYVAKSIFSNGNYEPDERVFGQIEDNKPWISLDICNNAENKQAKTSGPSEEARFILNPSILVAIEYPFLFDYSKEDWCNSSINQILPKAISYDGDKREITVVYEKLPFRTSKYDFYQFNGLNARDLGYPYVYVDMFRSNHTLRFSSNDNTAQKAVEFLNFIHTGGSCKVEGGCNNGSPRQHYFEFIYDNDMQFSPNSKIYIKLWKNKPVTVFQEADITEIIVIEKP